MTIVLKSRMYKMNDAKLLYTLILLFEHKIVANIKIFIKTPAFMVYFYFTHTVKTF